MKDFRSIVVGTKFRHGSAPVGNTGIAEKRVSHSEVPVDSNDKKAVGPDFICENHSSVFLLRPISPAAFEWVNEHLPEDRQTFGNAVAIDHRCIWAILTGLQEDGLSVSR